MRPRFSVENVGMQPVVGMHADGTGPGAERRSCCAHTSRPPPQTSPSSAESTAIEIFGLITRLDGRGTTWESSGTVAHLSLLLSGIFRSTNWPGDFSTSILRGLETGFASLCCDTRLQFSCSTLSEGRASWRSSKRFKSLEHERVVRIGDRNEGLSVPGRCAERPWTWTGPEPRFATIGKLGPCRPNRHR